MHVPLGSSVRAVGRIAVGEGDRANGRIRTQADVSAINSDTVPLPLSSKAVL